MERVTFLVERTNVTIPCLLNPESVTVKRTAGVRLRERESGPLVTAATKDDPLVFSGGGRTELTLDLLFDVSLVAPSVRTVTADTVQGAQAPLEDVRELTRPLVELTEGSAADDGFIRPPLVRFIWGKSWNIVGVVSAIAERLECFTAGGAPQRSWMRMRFLRVSEGRAETAATVPGLPPEELLPSTPSEVPDEQVTLHEVIGAEGKTESEGESERIDSIAHRYFSGKPWMWRAIAAFNNIDNPLSLATGLVLRIPDESMLGNQS